MNLSDASADPIWVDGEILPMTGMTISRRSFAVGLVAAFAVPAPLLARAADVTAKGFVEQIYAAYVGAPGQKGIPLEDATTIRRYFTPGLASLILDDQAAAQKRGEPPTLDGDAFVGHQEWDITGLAVDAHEAGSKATATVSFTNFGKAEKVVVELLRVGADWRIADIRWDDASTLRGLFRHK
jgi:hypothetical protein